MGVSSGNLVATIRKTAIGFLTGSFGAEVEKFQAYCGEVEKLEEMKGIWSLRFSDGVTTQIRVVHCSRYKNEGRLDSSLRLYLHRKTPARVPLRLCPISEGYHMLPSFILPSWSTWKLLPHVMSALLSARSHWWVFMLLDRTF